MTQLKLHHAQKDDLTVNIERLLIAGWADIDAIEHHIKKLEELGVSRPSTIPCYYQVQVLEMVA